MELRFVFFLFLFYYYRKPWYKTNFRRFILFYITHIHTLYSKSSHPLLKLTAVQTVIPRWRWLSECLAESHPSWFSMAFSKLLECMLLIRKRSAILFGLFWRKKGWVLLRRLFEMEMGGYRGRGRRNIKKLQGCKWQYDRSSLRCMEWLLLFSTLFLFFKTCNIVFDREIWLKVLSCLTSNWLGRGQGRQWWPCENHATKQMDQWFLTETVESENETAILLYHSKFLQTPRMPRRVLITKKIYTRWADIISQHLAWCSD